MPPNSRAWLRAAFAVDAVAGNALSGLPPAFLCPAVWTTRSQRPALTGISRRQPWTVWRPVGSQRRSISSAVAEAHADALEPGPEPVQDSPAPEIPEPKPRKLPLQCPGCGAFSQTTQPEQPGFFDLGRRSTMEYLGLAVPEKRRIREEDRIVEEALRRVDRNALASQGVDLVTLEQTPGEDTAREAEKRSKPGQPLLLCARCHDLVHHSAGTPIYHPDIGAMRETLAESPYKYNHVYHVLDAADFPMSLLPRIHELLDTMPLRSRNRRARRGRFFANRRTDLSFVITRADLLAPHKDQVDKLMPWIRETLRDALGRHGRNVRLGNVRCVSARRNWWTTELREEIWQNGGASWLVGKANVGKSYLVHHVFPKGRMGLADEAAAKKPLLAMERSEVTGTYRLEEGGQHGEEDLEDLEDLDEAALLPPPPPETNYPQMPVVSALAGTTASPIRIPFGRGRGELIDLPGLERRGLAEAVAEKHREDVVMKTRVQPEQEVLKGPHQSLLLGGMVRITPRTADTVFLAYNFTPLKGHRTHTDKAAAVQQQTSTLQVASMAAEGTGQDMRLAGSFPLRYDVTRVRTGPITRRDAVNISVDRLPYRVVALDILLEGCGWVEVVAQVRTKDLFREQEAPNASNASSAWEDLEEANETEAEPTDTNMGTTYAPGQPEVLRTLDLSEPSDAAPPPRRDRIEAEPAAGLDGEPELNWPVIDVFSPGGKFIGSRRPLNAWMLCKPPASWRKGGGGRSLRRTKGKKAAR